ncbi:MAG: glutamate synthase [Magnetovibrio sp.]|nr:glutamate synthase [Magnetovibrio sp.]|tara:strand:+ start:2177 stop:3604 length:1428 start_codon:yes stop_codon:yes gene_type:complete
MGKLTGFIEIARQDRGYRPPEDRIQNYDEFYVNLDDDALSDQGARCMDCGIPFCHNGCPVHNIIPEWNDLVYKTDWQQALEVLHSTNNFPEFTGRVCPAPCEAACTLNIIDEPVTIKTIECAIVDKGWENNWIEPLVTKSKTGRRVAVVGSGPAGMACAQQLARAGHKVTVFEKNSKIGGLLRYGIPDFKMGKSLIDRRIEQMQAEGVEFRPNSHVGQNITPSHLLKYFDAIALTGGSEVPRDLPIEGRELEGIHFAMPFLSQQNRRVSNELVTDEQEISAKQKHVVVIGGGDTGSDCVGTSNRQGASSVTQMEIMPKPPESEDKPITWPEWPLILRTSSSHTEGCKRQWAILTKSFEGKNKKVSALNVTRVEWNANKMNEVPGSEHTIKADLVLLAMGFINPVHGGMLEEFGVDIDKRGNVLASTETYSTSVNKIFAAGDMRRGQSLVVWAIREGRQCAYSIDKFLMGRTNLPR